MGKKIKTAAFVCIITLSSFPLKAQDVRLSIGTDIPYQYFAGVSLHIDHFKFSYNTGVLAPPYSDIIINLIKELGVDDVYINLLNSAYQIGWMNSLAAYFRFGSEKEWYIGPEFRLDYLTASDTPTELVEAVTGESIQSYHPNISNRTINVKLGLLLYAIGIRFGRSIKLSADNHHFLNIEISVYKHFLSQSDLSTNNYKLERLNNELNTLLWEDVFKIYGYLAGIGVTYSYAF